MADIFPIFCVNTFLFLPQFFAEESRLFHDILSTKERMRRMHPASVQCKEGDKDNVEHTLLRYFIIKDGAKLI